MKTAIFRIICSALLVAFLAFDMLGQVEPQEIVSYVNRQIDTFPCGKRDTSFSMNYLWGWFDVPNDAYRIARCFDARGQDDSVIFYLNKAILDGLIYRDSLLIYKDTFVMHYHKSIEFDYLQSSNRNTVQYDSLRMVLLSLKSKDQECRGYYSVKPTREEWEGQKRRDSLNQLALEKIIISVGGWPGISEVGKKGSRIAGLIAVHADRNLSFQEECLVLMFEALKNKNINSRNFAMLYDRWLLAKTGEQLFGTQIERKDGVYVPKKLTFGRDTVGYLRDYFIFPPLEQSLKRVNDYYRAKKDRNAKN